MELILNYFNTYIEMDNWANLLGTLLNYKPKNSYIGHWL